MNRGALIAVAVGMPLVGLCMCCVGIRGLMYIVDYAVRGREERRIAEEERQARIKANQELQAKQPPREKRKVSRENYNKILINMHIDQVEQILGDGKEVARGEGFAIVNYGGGFGALITITYGPGTLVQSKSMIGD